MRSFLRFGNVNRVLSFAFGSAFSSMVERLHDTQKVVGPIPTRRTNFKLGVWFLSRLIHGTIIDVAWNFL